jgi:hypothetical protein
MSRMGATNGTELATISNESLERGVGHVRQCLKTLQMGGIP